MELIQLLKQYYFSINPVYRRSFWIIFIFGNLLYLFTSINHLVGYHSYSFNDSLRYPLYLAGRYSHHWFSFPLLNQWSPLLFMAWYIFHLSLAAVLIARLWRLPHSTVLYTLFGGILLSAPHVFTWVYYGAQAGTGVIGFYALALTLAQCSSRWLWLVSAGLIWVALGAYQASFSTFIIIALGMLIYDILEQKPVRELSQKYLRLIGITMVAVIAYLPAYVALKLYFNFPENYMTETRSLMDLIAYVPSALINSFTIYFKDYEYALYGYKWVSWLMLLGGVLVLFFRCLKMRSLKVTGLIFALLFVLICSANWVDFIASNEAEVQFHARILFYGYVFVILFFVSLLIKSRSSLVSNLSVVLCIMFIYISSTNTLVAQRNWKLEFDRSTNRTIRLIARIEALPNFNPQKVYDLCMLGEANSYRSDMVAKCTNLPRSTFSPSFTISQASGVPPSLYLKHIDSDLKLNEKFTSATYKPHFIRDAAAAQLNLPQLQEMRPWPDKNSVKIIEDYIVIAWDQKYIDRLIKWAESAISETTMSAQSEDQRPVLRDKSD